MKSKTLMILLLAAGTVCISLSCSKNKLPRVTQVGKNTFGCKIDGEAFLPSKEELTFSGPSRPLLVSNNLLNGFTLFANSYSSNPDRSILVGLPYIKKPGYYSLHSGTSYAQYKLEYFGGSKYTTNNIYTGTVNITRCDTINQIYSGTFSFKGIDANTGKVVNVTDGRFDVKRQ